MSASEIIFIIFACFGFLVSLFVGVLFKAANEHVNSYLWAVVFGAILITIIGLIASGSFAIGWFG